MPDRRLRIRNILGEEDPILVLRRRTLKYRSQVYFHIVNRLVKYKYGRSKIVYIGTTAQGLNRILSSAGERARPALDQWGVDTLEVHAIRCQPVQKVKIWKKLETASILTFRSMYGEIPRFNKHGEKYRETDEFDYFNQDEIRRFIQRWE